jgi:hypothetical protein
MRAIRVAGLGGTLDGRIRRLLDHAGHPWRPAHYRYAGGRIRLFPDDGPFIVTGLATELTPVDEADRDNFEWTLHVDGAPRIFGSSWADISDDAESWARPLVIGRGSTLDFFRVDGGVRAVSSIALAGVHVDDRAAKFVKAQGELWGARVVATASASLPNASAELVLDADTFIADVVNTTPFFGTSTAGNVAIRVGTLDLTPQFLPLVSMLPCRPGDVGGRVNRFLRAGEVIRAEFQYAGTGALELSVLGWRRYG